LLPTPGGTLRLTPWRGIVVPGFSADDADERLRMLAQAGFVTRAGSPWYGLGACTGLPGCAKSRSDVRSEAEAAARTGVRVPATAPADDERRDADGRRLPADGSWHSAHGMRLPVYWSGCERRCGHPHGDWIDVLATGAAPQGGRVDAVVDAPYGDRIGGIPTDDPPRGDRVDAVPAGDAPHRYRVAIRHVPAGVPTPAPLPVVPPTRASAQ
jgi:precorrin-3B synthase